MNIPPKYEDVVAQLDEATGREAALRKELESIKASVDGYDSPEHAAQVADEMGHQCDALQQRLTVAEQRVGELEELLRDCVNEFSTSEASQFELEMLNKILAALKPAAEGEGS